VKKKVSGICSCGALAETMGDAHHQKMPQYLPDVALAYSLVGCPGI